MTGTNGKTTTVLMLAAMLTAAGHRAIAAGNVGTSVVDAVTEPEPYPVSLSSCPASSCTGAAPSGRSPPWC